MTPLSAGRYEVRFTASAETRAKLKRAQDLLRHAVPSGDPAEIVDRALTALIDARAASREAVCRRWRATSATLELRCRAHNAYEAALFYGPMHSDSPRDELRAGS